MRAETYLFGGVALFFALISVGYGLLSDDAAGTAALSVAFLMAAMVALFLGVQHRRHGGRPEDRRDGEIADRAGPLDFFPDGSPWPVVTALGTTLLGAGVAFGLWLFLLGFGVLAAGVFGFVFQYARRG
ncbi:cytochrome c oxidase subunit 4 [Streptomyces sp. TRM 70361]|uniref:aa3-type cytochrome oxidase subunit IV n=1 Tax=Streptomyces sp. TRM 70361 TaxID=3116553 RepID=UPI002E7B3458|nr:cytochrome c oxidase subunit 4 [Streptomyces sp. TRM 70361]MEE1942095.1 cytochrome c oxidase subunit 4 [Streptomyces sp. TRM 70361]